MTARDTDSSTSCTRAALRVWLPWLLLAAMLAGGCARPSPDRFFPTPAADGERSIFVTGHRYHTGIAVRPRDLPARAWPALTDFPDAEYLELGWGAQEYYPADEVTVGLVLRTVFTPSKSVINAVPINGSLAKALPGAEIIELRVSNDAFARMVAFVRDSHTLDSRGRATRVPAGANQPGYFYASPLTFTVSKNCNTWVARALAAAGLDVEPDNASLAPSLLRQVRELSAAAPPVAHAP